MTNIFLRIKMRYQESGISGIFFKAIEVPLRTFKNGLYNFYHKCFYWKKFSLDGEDYFYLKHSYNVTWENERTVEIPIIRKFVKNFQGKQILEVGNVLKNYYPFLKHDVIDKYEKVSRVINEDAVDFNPQKKYNLIFSISTLEHVGWDETPKEPQKIFKLFDNLIKNCLTKNGTLIFTVPIGYNSFLDEYLKSEKLPITKKLAMKRISQSNNWVEVDHNTVWDIKFNNPFPNANALIICVLGKDVFN